MMTLDAQTPVNTELQPLAVDHLLDPACFEHDTDHIRLIETHISWVILTGPYVYKIKKPVDLGFVDFSTLERRLHYCEEELRINRRLAPEFYLGVVPVTGTRSRPHLGGDGNPIDFAVKMREFPQEAILNARIARGELHTKDIERVAARVARFHADIADNPSTNGYGEPETIHQHVIDAIQHMLRLELRSETRDRLSALRTQADQAFSTTKHLMKARAASGFVRECHGDLHLRNIAMDKDNVIIFDGIEFNESLRWIDVISEVAFLFVDLCHHNQRALAWRFLNAYLHGTGDYAGLQLLDYYASYRAMVRALISRLQYLETNNIELRSDYLDYLSLAEDCFKPRQPRLMLTHGLAGCGKTTISRKLADECGAIHLRSDLERKRLLEPQYNGDTVAAPQQGIYTTDATDGIYDHLLSVTEQLLAADLPVVVDATFLKEKHRAKFRKLATRLHFPWAIFDIQAPDEVLEQRVATRAAQHNDASDATVEVLAYQRKTQEPLSTIEEIHTARVDGEADFDPRTAAAEIFRHTRI